jgi:hypothetical protein
MSLKLLSEEMLSRSETSGDHYWQAGVAIAEYDKHLKTAQAQAVNQQLLEALEAAIKFIDSHVADPDITQEMRENYAALQRTKPYDAIAAAQEGK